MKVIADRTLASAVLATVRHARAVLTSRVPAQPGGAVPSAACPAPAGPDWRTAIWRGLAPYPRRHGPAPPLRLPGPGSRLAPADRPRG